MRKLFYLFALSLLFSGVLKAQDSTANISMRNRFIAADSAAQSLIDYAGKHGLFIGQLIPAGFNTLTIGHQLSNGNYIPIQDAGRINKTYLHTAGKAMLNDIALWGTFTYHKIREDSTRWAQQTRNNPSAPFYYGSPAKISYNRTVYEFKAVAEKNMLSKNLPLALGIDYRIGDHYATNDPRGSVSDYQFNLNGSIGYHLSKNFMTGITLRYGYGQERVAVNYKNRNYVGNVAYPDYVNYKINGYGEPRTQLNSRKYQNGQVRYGFEGYLSYQHATLGDFILDAAYQNEMQRFRRRYEDSPGSDFFNNYQLNTYNFDLIWKKKLQQSLLVLIFNYQNTDGSDYNYATFSNNYLYNQNQLSAKAVWSTYGKIRFNYLIELLKNGEERQDGANGNKVSYNRYGINAGFGAIKTWTNQHNLGINLQATYSGGINDQLIIPNKSPQLFTDMVIYHDYLYHTSTFFGGSLSADYNFPAYKKIQTGIRLGFSYTDALDFKTLVPQPLSTPGNHRFVTNLSLNFYF